MERRIIVDADSCPVKSEIAEVAKGMHVEALFIASYDHYSLEENEGAKVHYVDSFSQSVDLAIVNLLKKGDVVITGDYGLASMVLKPNIRALSFKGTEYTLDNIDSFLTNRHISAKIRKSGGRVRGPKAFSKEDRIKFVENLRKILSL